MSDHCRRGHEEKKKRTRQEIHLRAVLKEILRECDDAETPGASPFEAIEEIAEIAQAALEGRKPYSGSL